VRRSNRKEIGPGSIGMKTRLIGCFVEQILVHGRKLCRISIHLVRVLVHCCSDIGSRRSRSNTHSNLALKVGSHPRETNGIEFLHALVGQLRLESPQAQRVLGSLFHDPTTKRLVRRVVLGHIDVAIVEFAIIQELVVAIVPSRNGCCDTPLKIKSVEFLNPISRQTRFGLGSLWQLSDCLEIGLALVLSLDFDPLTKGSTLRDVAVTCRLKGGKLGPDNVPLIDAPFHCMLTMFFFPPLEFLISLQDSGQVWLACQ
jgi:hypothetical protein